MNKLDADKEALVARYVMFTGASECWTSAAASAPSFTRMRSRHSVARHGRGLQGSLEQPLARGRRLSLRPVLRRAARRRAVRPGHDVALPRARLRSAAQPANGATRAEAAWTADHRGAAARQPHVRLVRRSLAGAAGAAAHGPLRSRAACWRWSSGQGSRSWTTCPTARSRAYFYLFTGAAFRMLKGRGLNLDSAHRSVLRRQVLLAPLLLFEKRLNLAMQTVVCRRPSMRAAAVARSIDAASRDDDSASVEPRVASAPGRSQSPEGWWSAPARWSCSDRRPDALSRPPALCGLRPSDQPTASSGSTASGWSCTARDRLRPSPDGLTSRITRPRSTCSSSSRSGCRTAGSS